MNEIYTTLQNKTKLRQILLLIQNNLYHDLRVQFKDHMLHYQICYPSKRKKRSRRFYVTQRQKNCNQSIRSFTKGLFSPLKMLLEQVTLIFIIKCCPNIILTNHHVVPPLVVNIITRLYIVNCH